MRRVVYTVLMGRYEPLLEQHVASHFDTDLVCFTDDGDASSATWEIRHVDPPKNPFEAEKRPPQQMVWFRANGRLPDAPLLQVLHTIGALLEVMHGVLRDTMSPTYHHRGGNSCRTSCLGS